MELGLLPSAVIGCIDTVLDYFELLEATNPQEKELVKTARTGISSQACFTDTTWQYSASLLSLGYPLYKFSGHGLNFKKASGFHSLSSSKFVQQAYSYTTLAMFWNIMGSAEDTFSFSLSMPVKSSFGRHYLQSQRMLAEVLNLKAPSFVLFIFYCHGRTSIWRFRKHWSDRVSPISSHSQ
jgi:hypothetical protein